MNVLFRPAAPLVGAHFLMLSRWLTPRSWLAAFLTALIPLTAWAQSARDPLDRRTANPPLVYESAYSGYQPYQDPEWISWKKANEVVREFGGMAAIGSMSEDSNSAHDAHKAGSAQADPPAQAAQDGSPAPQEAPAAATPTAPPTNMPADMKAMPGHDMSKMPQASPASPAQPAPKPAAPAAHRNMPGHGGMSH